MSRPSAARRLAAPLAWFWGGATIASGLVAAERDAHAFCRSTTVLLPPSYNPQKLGCFTDGQPLFWRGACVTYSVQKDAASYIPLDVAQATIDRSFATWNGVTCTEGPVGIHATARGPVECTEVRYNRDGPNQNLVVFREKEWPYADASSTLALTTVTFTADTGEIFDADIEINATNHQLSVADPVPSREFDLESVVTHEAGHFFGLAHATDTSATMFARYEPGTSSLRSLAPDDVAGICTIYPDAKTRSVGSAAADGGVLAASACSDEPRRGFISTCTAPADDDGLCAVSGGGHAEDTLLVVAASALVLGLGRRFRRG